MLECKWMCVTDLCSLIMELIDTCWNVNNENSSFVNELAGINRYMLECKYRTAEG